MEQRELENLPVPERLSPEESMDALAAMLGTKGVADEHLLSVPLGSHNLNRPMERLSQAPALSPRPRKPSFTGEARRRVRKFSDAARGRRPSRGATQSYDENRRGSLQPQAPVHPARGRRPSHAVAPSYNETRRGSIQPQALVHAAPNSSERTRRNRSTTPAPHGPRPRVHAPGVYDAAADWAVVPRSAGPAPSSRASRRQGMVFEDSFNVNVVDPREQAYLQLEGYHVVDYDHGAAMQSVRQNRLRKQPSMGTVRTMGTVASWNALNDFAYTPGYAYTPGHAAYTPGQVGFMGKLQAVKTFNKKIVGLFK